MDSSRRQFLSTAMLAAAAALPGARRMTAQERQDAQTSDLVRRTIGIDTHNHVDVPLSATDSPAAPVDLTAAIRASGLSAICMTFATDYQSGDAWERFVRGMDGMDQMLQSNGIRRALTTADLTEAHRQGKPTVIQAVEGGHFLQGDLHRLETAYRRGLRHLGLLHDSDATVPLGDVYTNPPQYGGLTALGANVIRECNRLGILPDLAHASQSTLTAALKISSRPVLISHTGLNTWTGSNPEMARRMLPRLIDRTQARMVADAGGLVGIWTHLSDSPLDYAHHLRAMAEIIGVDHLCIGTDTKMTPPLPWPGQPPRPARVGEVTRQVWADQKAGFYFEVVDAMRRSGFSSEEIRKIGGANYLRVFQASVG